MNFWLEFAGQVLLTVWILGYLDRRRRTKLRRRIRALEEAQFWKQVAAEHGTVWNRLRYLLAQVEELETRGESELWKPL